MDKTLGYMQMNEDFKKIGQAPDNFARSGIMQKALPITHMQIMSAMKEYETECLISCVDGKMPEVKQQISDYYNDRLEVAPISVSSEKEILFRTGLNDVPGLTVKLEGVPALNVSPEKKIITEHNNPWVTSEQSLSNIKNTPPGITFAQINDQTKAFIQQYFEVCSVKGTVLSEFNIDSFARYVHNQACDHRLAPDDPKRVIARSVANNIFIKKDDYDKSIQDEQGLEQNKLSGLGITASNSGLKNTDKGFNRFI